MTITVDVHLNGLSVAQDTRGPHLKPQEGLNRDPRPPLGACLEPASDEDQHNDDGSSLKIDRTHSLG